MSHHTHVGVFARQLEGITSAAWQVVEAAQAAYAAGLLNANLRENLAVVQHDLIRLLAIYEDGQGYNYRSPESLVVMRHLEQIISDLLEVCHDDVQ